MMQSSMSLMHELEEGETNFPDSFVRLKFVKSGYILGGNIPTLKSMD